MKKLAYLFCGLLALAAMTGCNQNEPKAPEKQNTYKMTIRATKCGENHDSAAKRVLSLDNETLNTTWAVGEQVTVYNDTKNADLGGYLEVQETGAFTTLSGTLTGTIDTDDILTLKFLSPNYSSQDGTLTGNATSIDKVCDYAKASVTVASVAGGIITTTADASFANQQAIVKFTLLKKADDSNLVVTSLTVNDGTADYTVTPASATNVLFVAIPATGTVNLSTTVDAVAYTYKKTGITLAAGEYYDFTVKMSLAPVDLSTLTDNYVAKDGETLTGTLNVTTNPYKISIAAGATVTLDGVTINGVNYSDQSSSAHNHAGLSCVGDATIILKDTNTVRGFYEHYPGIHVPQNKTVTIQGDGSLDVSSNGHGPGIGGVYKYAGGNIIITGGKITATGGSACAGIGSGGSKGSCGDITITGGTVIATGGNGSAGIGGSKAGSCGNITITSGVTSVTATMGSSGTNSIGAGFNGTCGTVTIGGTVYWNGTAYQNGGDPYLKTTPLVYQP